MASLADLFVSSQAPNAQTQLPMRATPFQRPRGLKNGVGSVLDALAIMGGAAPSYRQGIDAQENKYNTAMKEQQFQNVFRNFVENPDDPAVQANLAFENPEAFMKVAPQNKVVGDRVINMSPLGGTPKVLVDSPEKAVSPKDAALKRIESGAYTPEQLPLLQQLAGISPRGSDFQIVETPRGYEQVNRVTGETRPLGIAPPPRATASGGGSGGSGGRPTARPFTLEDYRRYNVDPSVPMVFDRYGQAKPLSGASSVADAGRGGISAQQFGQAKARIAKLPTLMTQIGAVENALGALEKSGATGFVGGRIPKGVVSAADVFDTAVATLFTSIQGLTRVAGEGSVSDYEQELKKATAPDRLQTPEGRKAAISNLKTLAKDLEGEYRSLTARPQTQRPPLDSFVR